MTPDILATASYGRRDAPPLLFIRALPAAVAEPRGADLLIERVVVRGPARVTRVEAVGRPPFLPLSIEMAEVADVYARHIGSRFGRPVAVMGLSTGASVALQLAVDHPELVSTLVVAAGAARLSGRGRAIQRRYAALLQAGDRGASAELASATMNSRRLDPAIRIAARLALQPDDPESLIALVRAEDGYDVLSRLHRVAAPTLVVSGGRDVFYPAELGAETVRRLPRGSHIVYRERAHGGIPLHPHFAGDIAAFLAAHP